MKHKITLLLIVSFLVAAGSVIYLYDVLTTSNSEDMVEIFTSPYITEFSIPTKSSVPNGIGVDRNGNVWFAEIEGDKLAMLDKNSYLITEYNIPDGVGEVWSLDFDSNGNIWFADKNDRIWNFDTADKSFKKYDVPTKGSMPTDLVIDADGKIWIAQLRNNYSEEGDRIAVFDPEKEVFTQYKLADKSGPIGLALDNENIWITQTYAHSIGKFNRYDFSYKQFEPSKGMVSPIGIAVDDKGTVWFAQHGASKVSSFGESNQTLFEFTTSPGLFPITTPYWILIDSKQNIWFNEHSTNKIARFIKENNTLIEYKIPSEREELVNVLTIALDQNDNLWFTEWSRNRIGVVNAYMPLPFTMDVSSDFVATTAGKNVELELTLMSRSNVIREIYFNASSTMTLTGEFVNSTIRFEPSSIKLGNSNEKIRVVLGTETKLEPDVYSVTVSASDEFITYARIITLEVL